MTDKQLERGKSCAEDAAKYPSFQNCVIDGKFLMEVFVKDNAHKLNAEVINSMLSFSLSNEIIGFDYDEFYITFEYKERKPHPFMMSPFGKAVFSYSNRP